MTEMDLNGVVLQGRYRIEQPLDRGGMSAVYKARHLALDVPVAIKLIRDDLIEDETIRARFEREARAAARLTHPNVVHIYDFGSFERGAYIVMEYIEGASLRQILLDQGRLPLEVAADFVVQASEAVAAAHGAGILHRDIKPENLMVYDDDAGRRRVKVVDFGLAKHIESEGTRRLTGQSQMIGTPKYMAPERVTDDEVDERADVYALAVVLFETLAGRAPFEGTFKEIIGQHLYEEPPTLASLGVDVPEEIERLIRQSMAKRPEERTPSAAEFARELAGAVDMRMTPSGSLVTAATTGPHLEYSRTRGSGPVGGRPGSGALPAANFAVGENRTRYAEEYGDEATKVRPRLPTLYMPKERQALASERTADVPVVEIPVLPRAPRRAPVAASTVMAALMGLAVFVAAGLGAWWLANRVAEEPPAAVEAPEPPPAQAAEPRPGSGTVTIPSDARTRIVLEMDPTQIKPGAMLAISGGSLAQTEMFALKRVRDDLSWVISDATRSIPGGRKLDDILKPGETFSLVVRNRDGTTSTPKVSVQQVK